MLSAWPGDPRRAEDLHHALRRISKSLFIETNPGPIKFVLRALGLIESDEVRAPLTTLTENSRSRMLPELELIRAARETVWR